MWRSVNAYAEANLVHEFLGDTDVTVTTLPVDYDLGGTSAEIGMGGTVSLLDNVFVYADVDYRIPFDDGRQGASVIGGLRVAF
jgi:outer membrane autotransporter protein